MSEREKKAFEEICEASKDQDEAGRATIAAIMAAYDAGKAAGEKKAAGKDGQ